MKMRIAGVVCTLLLLSPVVSQGEVWNLADDFSATQNPNGAWSFGWRETPEQPLALYVDNWDRYCDLDPWMHFIAYFCPQVQHNPHDYPVSCTTFTLDPYKVIFHPGPAQQSVVRWTSPGNLDVALTAHFASIDTGSKIVHVYRNGAELFSATLENLGETVDYVTTIPCQTGDVIDCAIDPVSFYYDTTQIDFILETAELPVGACCFASGDCLLGTEAGCGGAGGTYIGGGITCDPNPCESTPVRSTTWGQIKANYQ